MVDQIVNPYLLLGQLLGYVLQGLRMALDFFHYYRHHIFKFLKFLPDLIEVDAFFFDLAVALRIFEQVHSLLLLEATLEPLGQFLMGFLEHKVRQESVRSGVTIFEGIEEVLLRKPGLGEYCSEDHELILRRFVREVVILKSLYVD